MTGSQLALWIAATALYAAQAAAAGRRLLRSAPPAAPSRSWLAFGALALHGCFLLARGLQAHGLPMATRLDSAALFLWLPAAVFLAAERPFRLEGIAATFWPLYALCAAGMGALSGRAPLGRPALETAWLLFHLVPVYAGYAAFAIATGAGVARLTQQRFLRGKRPEALWARLPSLARLDQIARAAVSLGFPLFTVGLAAGAIWAERESALLGRAWYGDTKVIAGLAGWLIYAAVVHIRLFSKVNAKRAAVLTIAGFMAALATFAAAHAYPRPAGPVPTTSLTASKN